MSAASLNYLIGGGQRRFSDGQSESLGGFEIHHQLILERLLHRQVCRTFALEDPIDIGRGATIQVEQIGPV